MNNFKRRLIMYLRNTMGHKHLCLVILNNYKEKLDRLDLNTITNEFMQNGKQTQLHFLG